VFEWRLDSHLFFLKKEKDLKFHANKQHQHQHKITVKRCEK
jgi:hypothetical protein